MSSIGSGNIGAFNLAGSIAGTQKTAGSQTNDNKAEAAAQKFQLDQKALSEKTQDVAEADLSPDRDADGRNDYHDSTPHDELELSQQSEEEKTQPASKPDRAALDLDTGRVLDLEA
ncbi:MAG: hypothetical protein CMJ46_06245 [Planctomyces sp.]|nr:hypothetical protein [Planctomyces sp.]